MFSGLDLPSRPGTKHLGNADRGAIFLLWFFDSTRRILQLGYIEISNLAVWKRGTDIVWLDLAGAKSSDRGTSFTHCSAGRHQALRIYYASRETPIAYPLTLLSTCPKPAIPVALYTAILDITCTVHCLFNPIFTTRFLSTIRRHLLKKI
jgi:hypothetical protein